VKTPASRVLKYESYRSMPWRNGRGTTLEIAREPRRGREFIWRLSLADIERNGEFSAYPGYGRALVLVSGKSLRLRFRGHGHSFLDPAMRATRFEGDWQTHCAVPEGRCTDLSLIVRKGPAARRTSVVRAPTVLQLRSSRRVVLAKELHGAVFVLNGSVTVSQSISARTHTVQPRETLLLCPGPRRTLTLRKLGQYPAELVILRWRRCAAPQQR
jgi:environmental stress-induced protein Ves